MNSSEGADPGGAKSVPLVDNDWIDEGRDPLPVVLGGAAAAGALGNVVVSATIDYSMAEVSMSSLELEDEASELLRHLGLSEGVALRISGQRHIITAVGAKQGAWVAASDPRRTARGRRGCAVSHRPRRRRYPPAVCAASREVGGHAVRWRPGAAGGYDRAGRRNVSGSYTTVLHKLGNNTLQCYDLRTIFQSARAGPLDSYGSTSTY